MNINTDGLASLAGRRAAKAKPEWSPPSIQDFAYGHMLAFDQTLAKAGFVWLVHDVDGLEVVSSEMLKTGSTEGKGGHEENLTRGVRQYEAFRNLLASFYGLRGKCMVVHEAPPDGGGNIRRPESSLMASLALRIAVRDMGFTLAPQVAPIEHRKIVCGNPKADKLEEHRALAELAGSLPIKGYELVTNVDKRDALCVALSALHRGAR